MKRLLVMRHAKSSWRNGGLEDHERPLNGRGREAARHMGRYFRETGARIDLAIHSTAVRTRETLELLLEEYGGSVPTEGKKGLYLSSGARMLEVIGALPVTADTVLVVAHFPGVQEATLALAGSTGKVFADQIRQKFPTGAVADFELHIHEWSEIDSAHGRLNDYILPRRLR
jgi:phosphohistidine phosphatase